MNGSKENAIRDKAKPASFLAAGILLGLGLGGFFDGIVFHQLFQWHHLVSADYPPTSVANLELNTLMDGLFHVLAYAFTLAGLWLLWRVNRPPNRRPSTSAFAGAMLMGWGIFNLVEGIVDHHLLGIHHVRPGPNQLAWDLGFLVWGAVMLAGGWWLFARDHISRQVQTQPVGSSAFSKK
jgi:uncharacterized membrane protein